MAITFIVQGITIGAYAARLAGVQTKRIATSISLFNLFVTLGRLATLFSVFFVAPLADVAGSAIARYHDRPEIIATWQHTYEWQLRLIILAGTFGMVIFALFLPMFTYLFRRGVHSFERRGSVPHALAQLLKPQNIRDVFDAQRIPSWSEIRAFDFQSIPKRMLIFNVIVTGVYAIGVPAAFLASVYAGGADRTATSLSGVINGIGTIAFTLFVDPTSSMMTDQAIHGKRSVEEIRSMVFYLSVTAIVGTVLSQLVFFPAAVVIDSVAKFAVHVHF